MLAASGAVASDAKTGVSPQWQERVAGLVWVTYSPTNADPDRDVEPEVDSIRKDLDVLRRAGFTGLVTYGATGAFGEKIVSLAEAAEFRGVIYGVWDPRNTDEIESAQRAAHSDIVLGYCVGNEGLGRRYEFGELKRVIAAFRNATGKPVATTEEFDDYEDESLLSLGDWVFPNVHPFFHGREAPDRAVRWTKGAYDDLSRAAGRFVWFKEVGLPTGGDSSGTLSPEDQEQYYVKLAKTPVRFCYFEAFDQPWKNWKPFEQQWGLFDKDRVPKKLAARFLMDGPPRFDDATEMEQAESARDTTSPAKVIRSPFYVYLDDGHTENHFAPTGLDGDCGDIRVDAGYRKGVHSGTTCLRTSYMPEGRGPNKCNYGPPCRWAALHWQHPPGNTGDRRDWAGAGYDLTGYERLVFWARAEAPCTIKFLVGGLDTDFGDSLHYPRTLRARLGTDWKQFEIDLAGADLQHIVTGFGWATNTDVNPQGVTLYLDDIRFE